MPPNERTVLTHIGYSRAYYRFWRDALLLEILQNGVSPHLIRLIRAWLTNHQSWATFEGAKCMKTILQHGVHQGSVLSPLLLLFYIVDLHWGSEDLHASIYADNVSIRAHDNKLHIAQKRIQRGLDAVTTRSKHRKMLFSVQSELGI